MKYSAFLFALTIITFNANAQIRKKMSDKDDKKDKTEVNYITSPTHAKYLNQIVFANNYDDLKSRNENESGFLDTINFSETLRFRAYMDRPLVSSSNENPEDWTYRIKFHLDDHVLLDTVLINANMFNAEEKKTLSTFNGILIHTARPKYGSSKGPVYGNEGVLEREFWYVLMNKFNYFTPGYHSFKVDLIPFNSKTKIEGTVITSGNHVLFVDDVNKANDKDCLPTGGQQLQDLIEVVKKNIVKCEISGEVKKIEINSPEGWLITKNQYGVVLSRHFEFTVGYSDGGVCKYRTFDASQNNVNGKFEQKTTIIQTNFYYSPEIIIQCDCLK